MRVYYIINWLGGGWHLGDWDWNSDLGSYAGEGIGAWHSRRDLCQAQIPFSEPGSIRPKRAWLKSLKLSLVQTNPIEPGTPPPPVNWYTGYKSTRLYLVPSSSFCTWYHPSTLYQVHPHPQQKKPDPQKKSPAFPNQILTAPEQP